MRKAWVLLVIVLCSLGGCTWIAPEPPGLFPTEIVAGWRLDTEAALSADDLPSGAAGGWAATWKAGAAWIWAEVVTLGSPAAATALFSETVATFLECEQDRIRDEGVRLVHNPSGLVLHLFRVGPSLAAVGSLAGNPGEAPSPDLVRRAAVALAGRLPYTGAAVAGGVAAAVRSLPATTAATTPPTEIELELRDSGGRVAGTLTLRVYVRLVGETGGICTYRLAFHLARIRLHQVPSDGPFRGPLDLFMAGVLELPCGRLTFVTEELAHLRPGGERSFEEPGPLLGELDCAVPCWHQNIPINLNIVLRNGDDDLLDLLKAFVLGLGKVEPKAGPLWELVEDLIRTYGPPAGNPPDPILTAERVRGTSLGRGEAAGNLPTEVYSGGIRLDFGATLAIAGSCSRPAAGVIHCRVPEGATGTLTLVATRTPMGAVNIAATSLPAGWPAFPGVSGWGTVTALYRFTVPAGSAGRRYELRFKAWTAGVVGEVEIRVILDAVPGEAIGSAANSMVSEEPSGRVGG